MGFDKEGKIVGLRVKTYANLGTLLSTFALVLHGCTARCCRRAATPEINVDVTDVFTHHRYGRRLPGW